jgi:monothiol glutaredoxin
MALSESMRTEITSLLAKNRVVLFMKGNRHTPQCGFSAQVVAILEEVAPEYETVDVLSSPEIRDGIKEFGQWPTIPQLYVDGKLVGGCDIVRELSQSGELGKLIGADDSPVPLPSITISEGAQKAFEGALAEANGEVLHLKIDAHFMNDLFFGPREAGDIEVKTNGPTLFVDRATARRADGMNIDFIPGAKGGFKIKNPNEPPKVMQLGAAELKAMHDKNEITLFDVRPEPERALAKIDWARPLDQAGQEYLFGLDKNTPIAFHCHSGVRSQNAAEHFLREGFKKVYNVEGGIDAWSRTVDPSVPRY